MLSIYDYLKLEDLNGNMTELNDETFTGMLFRKCKGAADHVLGEGHNCDLNTLLDLDYLKPVDKDGDNKGK